MPSYTHVTLVGHLTRDPEVRYTPSDRRVASCGIAVNERRKDGDDEVHFFDIQGWNQRADFMGEYLHKGDCVLVDGRLRQERWEDKDGNKRSKVTVVINNIQGIRRNEDGGQPRRRSNTRPSQPAERHEPIQEPPDDEPPF